MCKECGIALCFTDEGLQLLSGFAAIEKGQSPLSDARSLSTSLSRTELCGFFVSANERMVK